MLLINKQKLTFIVDGLENVADVGDAIEVKHGHVE